MVWELPGWGCAREQMPWIIHFPLVSTFADFGSGRAGVSSQHEAPSLLAGLEESFQLKSSYKVFSSEESIITSSKMFFFYYFH